MNEKRSARARLFQTIKEIREYRAENPPLPRVEAIHKVGSRGDRKGWRKSIGAEIGNRGWATPEEKAWRDAVLHRDNYACVHCGSRSQLEADHIKPWSIYPEYRFHVDNGRTLCHDCHVLTPTYGRKIKSIVGVEVENVVTVVNPSPCTDVVPPQQQPCLTLSGYRTKTFDKKRGT